MERVSSTNSVLFFCWLLGFRIFSLPQSSCYWEYFYWRANNLSRKKWTVTYLSYMVIVGIRFRGYRYIKKRFFMKICCLSWEKATSYDYGIFRVWIDMKNGFPFRWLLVLRFSPINLSLYYYHFRERKILIRE